MNKYLFFILFGIILFLIYNNIETITIATIAKNRGSNTCIISQNCERTRDYDDKFIPDICNDNCNYLPIYDQEDCREYHTNIKKCAQLCELDLNLDSPDKNLNNAGFEKIPNFLDTTHPHTQLMMTSLDGSDFKYNIESYNSLTFIEYIFRTYLEKIHNGYNMRLITNGIYYINNKLYIVYSDSKITPRVIKQGNPDITNTNYPELIRRGAMSSFPFLHTDSQNIVKWEQKEGDPLTHCMPQYFTDNNFTSQDYLRDVHKRWYKNGLDLSLFNTKLINIWILLEGTEQLKTMGFMDFIDEGNPDLYRSENGTYKNLVQNENDPDKLYPFFTFSIFPYIHNRNVRRIPNTEPRTIYSYNMNNNDAFVFNTDIPHIGLNGTFDDNPDYLRVSIEMRYEYIDFDVSNINFNITYEILTTCAVDMDHLLSIDELTNIQKWEFFHRKSNIVVEGDGTFDIEIYVNYIKLVYGLIVYIYNDIWIKNYLINSVNREEYEAIPELLTWSILELKTNFDDHDDIQTDRYGRFNDPIVCKKFLDSVPYDVLHGNILNMSFHNQLDQLNPQQINELKRIITQFLTV